MSENNSFMAERFDLRRFLLLAAAKLWWVIPGALLGAMLFGGGYYIRHFMLADADVYRSDAMYYITFTAENMDVTMHYYNDYTWNDVLDSDEIAGVAAKMSGGITKEQIAAATRVPTMSDIHLIHVYVEAKDPETAESIQNAIGMALSYFAHQTEEGFEEISQWDRKPATVVKEANLISRWIIAGALLGAVCAFLAVAYAYVMDDTVRLEKDLYRIADLRDKIAGSLFAGKKADAEYDGLKQTLAALLDGRTTVCLCGIDGKAPEDDVVKAIREALPEGVHVIGKSGAATSRGGKKGKNGKEEKTEQEEVLICCIAAGRTRLAQLERQWNQKKAAEAVVLTDVKYALHKAYYLGKDKA